jgi:hypothetical protein
MSVQNPAFKVTRWSVVGMEGMWAKMFDPPTESPIPTDQLLMVPQNVPDGKGGTSQIRPNPVPEVMAAAGLQNTPAFPHTVQRDLLHNLVQPTWDGLKSLQFFVIGDRDNPAAAAGTYPGPTLRMPRGVIFNSETTGKGPPPHTIHWHGMEPTPLNDGVGHCSMEIGHYTYQWQPNFMGFYFLHCHRNTVQHFEFGLFSAMIFEAPDAYFASIASTNAATGAVTLNNIPIGAGRDGKRRCACNLDDPLTGLPRFTQFPGFNRNPVDTPDPGPGPTDTQISFPTDPHAMTVPFDVEALMVFDDRDSVWSDLAANARTTFPAQGSMPGVNDLFAQNPGVNGFASFNDFNPDYWFVTGVPVPAHKGGVGTIPAGLVIPPALNSGITGTQISVNAKTGDTVLIRILDAAYHFLRITLPVDCVIIAWDGRALGVAPYAHNEAYLVPAGTKIDVNNMAVGRRFDALVRSTVPINDFIIAEFINHKSLVPEAGETEEIVMTCKVPFNIGGTPIAPPAFTVSGKVVDQLGAPVTGVDVRITSLTLAGSATQVVATDGNGNYAFTGIVNGSYDITPSSLAGHTFKAPTAQVVVNSQNLVAPNFTASIATFGPNSYSLNEAIDSLKEVVGIKAPTAADKLRFDVSPIFNGIPAPDGVLDLKDSLNILRMVVGLNPL